MAQIKVEAQPRYGPLDVGDTLGGLHVAATVPGSPQMVLDVPADMTPDAAIQELRAAGLIVDGRVAHNDYSVLWLPQTIMAEPLYLVGDTFPLQGCTEGVRARGQYGAGVLVAICDTGVDAGHVAFQGKDVRGDTADSHSHGTHVASTAASAWGIASDATILSKQVLPNGNGSEALVANGIREVADYATAQRAPCVMNLSLGGSTSQVIDAAVVYARQRGVLVCAAAGNGYGAPIGSPARVADIIVLAVDRQRQFAPFTDGRGWTNTNRVSCFGVDIVAARANSGDAPLQSSGTSMATPGIVGATALLLGAGYSPQDVVTRAHTV